MVVEVVAGDVAVEVANDDAPVDVDVRDVVRDAGEVQKYPPRQKYPEILSTGDVPLTIFV